MIAVLLRYVVAAILALLIMTSPYGGTMEEAVRAAGILWWLITLGVFLGIAWVMQSLGTLVSRWRGTR